MRNDDSTRPIWRFNRVRPGMVPCLIVMLLAGRGVSAAGGIFDMDAIRDPKTLEVKVHQDWHVVQGLIATRQKLVTINVGDMWAGQEYRVPVRMVVPWTERRRAFISPAEVHRRVCNRIRSRIRWSGNYCTAMSGW